MTQTTSTSHQTCSVCSSTWESKMRPQANMVCSVPACRIEADARYDAAVAARKAAKAAQPKPEPRKAYDSMAGSYILGLNKLMSR